MTFERSEIDWAVDVTGGLSHPSKMPCAAWSIPASSCKVGAVLAKNENSVCARCYAADDWDWLKRNPDGWRMSRYAFSNTKKAMERRLAKLYEAYHNNTLPDWAHAMTVLILNENKPYFRWFDSGDIQGLWHLAAIHDICLWTPKVKHWLPTKEGKMLKEYEYEMPDNLVVRLSAPLIDQKPRKWFWPFSSTVSSDEVPVAGSRCEAYLHDHKCGDCRKCWDKRIHNIDYLLH